MTTYLTEADLAEKFEVPVSTISEWRGRYGWPHIKVGKRIRFTEADVRAIEALHHVAADKPEGLPGQSALSVARSR